MSHRGLFARSVFHSGQKAKQAPVSQPSIEVMAVRYAMRRSPGHTGSKTVSSAVPIHSLKAGVVHEDVVNRRAGRTERVSVLAEVRGVAESLHPGLHEIVIAGARPQDGHRQRSRRGLLSLSEECATDCSESHAPRHFGIWTAWTRADLIV